MAPRNKFEPLRTPTHSRVPFGKLCLAIVGAGQFGKLLGQRNTRSSQCSTRCCIARGVRFVLNLLYIEQCNTWCCIALGASRVAPVLFGCPCRPRRGRFQHARFSDSIQGRAESCTGLHLFEGANAKSLLLPFISFRMLRKEFR